MEAPTQDPAVLALQLQHKLRLDGRAEPAGDAQPLGWVDVSTQPERLEAWIAEVEALHQGDASTSLLEQPDLEALMQAWTPEKEQQLKSSPLPDPTQDIDVATYARLCLAVVGISTRGGLAEALHTLFSLYLEFSVNPAFHGRAIFD